MDWPEPKEREIDLWLFKQEARNPTKVISPELADKIKEYCLFHIVNDFDPLLNQKRYLLQLPIPIRSRLEEHFFAKLFKTFNTFFDNVVEEDFTNELLTKFRPES